MKPAKTAGTSILRSILLKRIKGIIHQKDNPKQFTEWLKKITEKELENYFIFAVTRNPWDRVVSIASYFKIQPEKFIEEIEEICKKRKKVRAHSFAIHHYTHSDGQQITDQLCSFENLQEDLNKVFKRIGLPNTKIPHRNKSSRTHYSRYYNKTRKEIVARIYEKDIQYYGYEFKKA